MAIQFSTTVRNARLDQVESTISTSPKLRIYSGTIPADCAAAITGTLLVEMSLPSDWMAAASGGSKAMSGSWTGNGVAAGNASHFRIWNNAASTCHVQGTVAASSADMTVDNVSIAVGQAVTVNSFTLTDANA